MFIQVIEQASPERMTLVDKIEELSLLRGSLHKGMSMPPIIKKSLISVLDYHQDTFVWEEEAPSQKDRLVVYMLKVNPTFMSI